nr:single-stranded DNA-binding protein [Streptomyces angustmyceticus]
MYDTMVTLVGNAATAVEHRQTTAGVTVARFRLATTSRRWDRAQERWTDGGTSFYTVRSWRALADNVAASVAVGEPLVVQGRLRLREGESPPERGGQRWFSAEVDAVAIGHDLARGTAAFRRVVRPPRTEGTVPVDESPPADAGSPPDAADSPPTAASSPVTEGEAGTGRTAPPDGVARAEEGAGAAEAAAEAAAAGAERKTSAKPPTPPKRPFAGVISPPSEPPDAAVPPTSTAPSSPEKVAMP